MPEFVADASVAAAWILDTQSTPQTDRLIEEVAAGGSFVVPAVWALEVVNVILLMGRRKRLSREEATEARHFLFRLSPKIDLDAARFPNAEIYAIAERYGLTTYDAAYVELAARLNLPLASKDERMNTVARACGVRVLL